MARMSISLLVIAGGIVTAGIASGGAVGGSETINYTYDAKGRLILVQHSGTVNNNVTANYVFDAADNRKNLKVTGVP